MVSAPERELKDTRIMVRISRRTLKRLKQEAQRRNTTVSGLLVIGATERFLLSANDTDRVSSDTDGHEATA